MAALVVVAESRPELLGAEHPSDPCRLLQGDLSSFAVKATRSPSMISAGLTKLVLKRKACLSMDHSRSA